LKEFFGRSPGGVQRRHIGEGREAQVGETALARAEKFSWPAQLQVDLGEPETVGRRSHRFQALARAIRVGIGDEQAVRWCGTASDPSAELVQLG